MDKNELNVRSILAGRAPKDVPVTVKGWVRTRRDSKAGISFVHLSDGSSFHPVQVVAPNTLPNYADEVLKITTGCAVEATGMIVPSPAKGQPFEMQASAIRVIGWVDDPDTYPIQPKPHTMEFLREVAHLRPRTNVIGAATRVRHTLAQAIHRFFDENGFLWVNTPIITSSDAEGAGALFRVSTLDLANLPRTPQGKIDFEKDFFGRETFLTVSGQLNVEAYCLALAKVYTFGPTFRAENSNTSRHLAEFWMIEPEIAFADLSDDATLAERLLKYTLAALLKERQEDLAFFDERVEKGLVAKLEGIVASEFVRMDYGEAIAVLENAQEKKETFEFPVRWGIDLQSEHERYLTEKHARKPVIVMNYPKDIKAFYMRVNDDGKTVAAMDVLAPGIGEIIGGSQREERLDVLDARMTERSIDKEHYGWYRDLRRYGTVPHAGFGLGFERTLAYVTGLGNVRDAIPFRARRDTRGIEAPECDVSQTIRLGLDIGGTFTDVALEVGDRRFTAKTLTTSGAPEDGVLTALRSVTAQAGIAPRQVGLIIHGTTLATNAIIERKGARTALLTTEGFRDVVEIRHENRFEQYDVNIDLPPPLVPRRLRLPVRERIDAQGDVLVPLDDASLARAIDALAAQNVEAVAVGLLHSFTNPEHEQRIGEAVARRLPGLAVTLSSDVSPEMREYERFSTACANAYIQPLMGRYLTRLEGELAHAGFACPMLLMTSGGGITTVDTAVRYPVRLVESGPAAGAIFAGCIARQHRLDQVLSFDMGGTTAKICLIDKAQPQTARVLEVARIYRFLKGSGLPLRIPVIEMVEIGAGGGSIARVDTLGRIAVGPDSAGSQPGPVCYGRGGSEPTVTDADVALGRIDPETFSGGRMPLDPAAAARAIAERVGVPLALATEHAALGISEMVDENMANAARVHAIESGKDARARTLIAFGGAAPLHAARVAEKLGISRVLVPANAGVGSAVGLLRAPVAYEIVRGRLMRLGELDAAAVNRLLGEMRAEAEAVVRRGAPDATLAEQRSAFMRYRGQGHEIAVALPVRELTAADRAAIAALFEVAYRRLYSRSIPGVEIEIMSWVVTLSAPAEGRLADASAQHASEPKPRARRAVFDPDSGEFAEVPIYRREDLAPGARIRGPAVIAEDETSTVVSPRFDARIDGFGYIELAHRED